LLPLSVLSWLYAMEQHTEVAASIPGKHPPAPPALTDQDKTTVAQAVRSLSEILQPARERGNELEKVIASMTTRFIGASADGLRRTGRLEEALFTINGAIARATNSGVELDLSELLRIKSQILAVRHDRESAMNCLTEALTVARAQSALALELRLTMNATRVINRYGNS
jgi:hypothetical protein